MSEKVKLQDEEIKALTVKINLLINGRKSNTSSTPSSHDIGRSNSKNLRIKTGRSSGAQDGHPGATLAMKAIPDEVIDHKPCYCSDCGTVLEQEISTVTDRRQEVVIPPVEVKYVEHREHTKTCAHCGKINKASLPQHLKAPIQYGHSVAAMAVYFSVFQYVSYKRIALLFRDIFRLPISEGTIDNMLENSMNKALPVYELIQQKLENGEVAGADESGCRIAGKKGWFHTWQNKVLTYIAASMNRGYATIEQHFPKGLPKATLVSDCWAAQLKTPALHHQLCLVHLLRELNNFIDALSCKWSEEMKLLIKDAIALKHQLKIEDYKLPNQAIANLEQRLENLLKVDYTNKHTKLQAFIKRLIKHKDSIFTFLHHYNVPADNNASESAIRNVKVKTKVSGQFRSENGAKRFAVLRSVIDTTIKNAQNVYDALFALQMVADLTPT